jgi:hypothetical protein
MKKSSQKMKCNSCRHGICQVCGGCHHPNCKRTVRPLNGCFNQLLTPERSQPEEKYRDAFMLAGLTNDQWGKVYNLIKIERSDARKEGRAVWLLFYYQKSDHPARNFKADGADFQ